MAIHTGEMTLFHTHTLKLKPNSGQQNNLLLSPERKAEDCIDTSFWWIYTQRLIDACVKFSFPQTHLDYTQLLGLWVRVRFGCLLQWGCLESAARDRVYKNGSWHFFVCSLSACVMGAEGWKSGPWVGKVSIMHLGSQSLWCYCWQRRESLRMGPAKGQPQLPPLNMRMTTLWATQVLLLLTHDS